MTTLTIRLMGPLRVDFDGQPITNFKTNKVRGLLAYLAVEKCQPHSRESLAGMFWPEYPERRARANLSQALFMLRRSIGDDTVASPFLITNRDTIQFNPASKLWLDVDIFTDGVTDNKSAATRSMIRNLEEAVALYQGEFLEGFSLSGSSPFEAWCLSIRERLHRLMIVALTQLTDFFERINEYETALRYAWHLVELDSWREEAYAAVMRLLALCGRRSEALAQYDACRRMLDENLGIAPMRQTMELYEAIRDEQLEEGILPDREFTYLVDITPSFLNAEPPSPTTSIFVGRDQELTRLNNFMESVLKGHGQVVFMAGEAGSGKTVLMQEFARWAMERCQNLLVASGKCTAYTGIGDPYAAFREITSQLTGNVANRWAAGTISHMQALRLWRALPRAVPALVQNAPDLMGTFVNSANLLARASDFAQEARLDSRQSRWLAQLEKLVARSISGIGLMGQHQSAIFEQFVRLLVAMAHHSPLLLILDDLQWADVGSIGLLFHISRNLVGQRILLLGAFRPEEIAVMQNGKRHPLEPVIHEIQHDSGDIILELETTSDPLFVEALVDSEPNKLDAAFRAKLFQQTDGHPLFTAELLRGLKERGDLLKNEEGRWVVGTELDWDTLPPRVESVIAERVGRLPLNLKRLLQAASVQGEIFIGEVVARALHVDEDEAILALGSVLSRVHRLVRAHSFERTSNGGNLLSVYQFHHFLFQKFLYNSLDIIEKARLHEATGETLALLVGKHISDKSVLLARHFEAAKIVDKAVDFRYLAGNYAIKLSANAEAIDHFSRGLTLLETLAESPERTRQELALQLGLGTGYQLMGGYTAPEAHRAYCRAHDLCREVGESPLLVAALWPLATHAAMIGDLPQALKLAKQALVVAKRVENPLFISVAQHHLGWILHQIGRFVESSNYQDEVISFYDRRYHEEMVHLFGHDFGVTSLGWSSWPIWYLGYPDKALQRCHEAIALAQSFDHPFSLMHAYTMTASIHGLRGEGTKTGEFGERILALATSYGFTFYTAPAYHYLGTRLIGCGQIAEGIAHWRKSLEIYESAGARMLHRGTLISIAMVYAGMGQHELGQGALAEAEALGFNDLHDSSLEHVRGLIKNIQGQAPVEVEACLFRAIKIARKQQAKSLELRATMSLCQLWQGQGRQKEAREKLIRIYNWFTEGFDTADLRAAAALLEELA